MGKDACSTSLTTWLSLSLGTHRGRIELTSESWLLIVSHMTALTYHPTPLQANPEKYWSQLWKLRVQDEAVGVVSAEAFTGQMPFLYVLRGSKEQFLIMQGKNVVHMGTC